MIIKLSIANILFFIILFCALAYKFVIEKFLIYNKIKEILSLLECIYTNGHVFQTARDKDYIYNMLDNHKIIYAKKGADKDKINKAKSELQSCLLRNLYNLNNKHKDYTTTIPSDFGILDKSEYKDVLPLFDNPHKTYNYDPKDVI